MKIKVSSLPVYIALFSGLCSCVSNSETGVVEIRKDSQGSFFWVDIDQATDTVDFDISQLFKSGEMIRLDNKPEALIGRITDLEISDNYIVLYNQGKRILLFNREGELIRLIGKVGKGPFEYLHVNGLAFSEDNNLILADRAYDDDFIAYSIEGKGLFKLERQNKGAHLFRILDSNTILSIGYHSVPWQAGITDSINLYHLDFDGTLGYSEVPIKNSYQIRVGGIPIPLICYPYNEDFRFHFAQDTLFSYDPRSNITRTDAVFTSTTRGFDYQEINRKIANESDNKIDYLGCVFVEVYAENDDYYLLHGVVIEPYTDVINGATREGITPESIGYFVVNKKTKKLNPVRLVDSFWGLDLQKDAYAIPFNKLKFSNNSFAYYAYDAIDFKEDVDGLVANCPDPAIKQKLKKLDDELSEDDNTILFVYEIR